MDYKKNYIQYFFIGKTSNKTVLFDFDVEFGGEISKKEEIFEIFAKYCEQSNLKLQERDIVSSNAGNFYITNKAGDVIYIVFAAKAYPQRLVFELIDEVHKNKVPINHVVFKETEVAIKAEIEKFQDLKRTNTLSSMNEDLKEVKVEIRENLKHMAKNIDTAHELQERSEKINEGAEAFKNDAIELKRVTWWNNCRLTIIIGLLVVGIILAIVLPIALKSS